MNLFYMATTRLVTQVPNKAGQICLSKNRWSDSSFKGKRYVTQCFIILTKKYLPSAYKGCVFTLTIELILCVLKLTAKEKTINNFEEKWCHLPSAARYCVACFGWPPCPCWTVECGGNKELSVLLAALSCAALLCSHSDILILCFASCLCREEMDGEGLCLAKETRMPSLGLCPKWHPIPYNKGSRQPWFWRAAGSVEFVCVEFRHSLNWSISSLGQVWCLVGAYRCPI